MKKFVSLFVILAMMFSFAAVNTSAAVGLSIDQAFNTMEEFTTDFAAGAFYVAPEGGLLYGYAEARALQSINNNVWVTYDMEVTVAFGDDEMSEVNRNLLLSYPNTNLEEYGRFDGTCYMNFIYDFEKDEFVLVAGGGADYDEDDTVLAGPLSRELKDDGSTFYKLGMSVDKGRIRCFLDGELIFDYQDTTDEWMIAHETDEPFLLWNTGNFIQVDHVQVSSVGFLFPYAPETEATTTAEPTPTEATTTQGGDDPVPTETTTQGGDDPAPTGTTTGKVEDPANSNDDPANTNKAPDNSNAPANTNNNAGNNAPADTNTNKPTGGSSTATGDATFVVVAAMVAAIGCALIVRKVNVK